MSICSITIKIKDYFPKIESIPFKNYVCHISNGDTESEIPLTEKDFKICQNIKKFVNEDIKYKLLLLDIIDNSLIGMCEIVIPYIIINQINPSNSFIKEQQIKLLMDLKTKRKLFGTVISPGDIFLLISAEVEVISKATLKKNITSKKIKTTTRYSCSRSPIGNNKKDNYNVISTDYRSFARLKNNKTYGNLKQKSSNNKNSANNSMNNNPYFSYTDQRNKKNFSQNKNLSNYLNSKGNDKLSNFNDTNPFHYLDSNENVINTKNNLRSSKNNKSKNFNNNDNNKNNKENLIDLLEQKYQKDKKNKSTISSENSSENQNINSENKKFILNNTNENINTKEMVYTKKAIRKNCSMKTRKTSDFMKINNYNLGESKIVNENITGIDFNNININNTFFSTNPTEQELVDMDRIILEKGASLRNDFFNQINSDQADSIFNKTVKNLRKTNNNNMILKDDNDKYTNTVNNINSQNGNDTSSERKTNFLNNKINIGNFKQEDLKNNMLNLLDFYSLLTQKIKIISKKNNDDKNKFEENREKFFYEIKKLDRIVQKDKLFEMKQHIHVDSNSFLNEKLIEPMLKIKKAESKIFQNIFNIYYYEYDILKFKEKEKEKLFDEQNIIQLLLTLINNIILITGNVSQVFKQSNETLKFQYFKSLLARYNITEKNEGQLGFINFNNLNSFMGIHKELFLDKNKSKNVVDDDIKVIKEVEEDKEDDEEKESDKNEEERDQIDKILLEEFPKKYKCKYNFTKKNKNEYMFNDMNIYAYFDEENNKKLLFKINNDDKEIEYEKFILQYIDKEKNDDGDKNEHNQKKIGNKMNLNMNSNIYRRKIRSKKYIINSDNREKKENKTIKENLENKDISEIVEIKKDKNNNVKENIVNQSEENFDKENIETKNENNETEKNNLDKL